MNQIKTDFLTPTDSFLMGFGSVMNLGGTYYRYNVSKDEAEADRIALYQDWRKVGQDLEEVMRLQSRKLLQSTGG